jgi:hypothetical protein
MANLRLARLVLSDVSGIAANDSVMDFSFNSASSDSVLATGVTNWINAGGVASLANYVAPTRSRVANACRVDVYDLTGHLAGDPHGSPTLSQPFTLGASAATLTNAPQIALVIAFHAAFGTVLEHGPTVSRPTDAAARHEGAPATHPAKTRPRASLRGRVYLGPLNLSAIGGSVGGPVAGLVTAAKAACAALLSAEPGWSVWSRVNSAMNPITNGWIDTDFGVIRTRRPKSHGTSPWP